MQASKVKGTFSPRLWGVLAICVALPLQGLVSFSSPEPYPTVRMPAFGSVPQADGSWDYTSVNVRVEYEDGSKISPFASELLEGIRHSSTGPSLSFLFGPSSEITIDEKTKLWLREKASNLNNGAMPTLIEFCWKETTLDTKKVMVDETVPCEITEVIL